MMSRLYLSDVRNLNVVNDTKSGPRGGDGHSGRAVLLFVVEVAQRGFTTLHVNASTGRAVHT